MDVTGVPSADPGHRSATPVAVATLWGIQRGTRQVGAAPVTVLPTPTIRTHLPLGKGPNDVMRPSGRGAHHTRSESRTSSLLTEVRDLHVAPGLSSVHACTPTRWSEAIPRHNYRRNTTGRAAQSSQDEIQDEIQDDSDARRLPTVHFLQCSTTVPRDLRENDNFHTPTHVHRPSL